jgi:hypothetical protein
MDVNDSFRLNEKQQEIDSTLILVTEIIPSLKLNKVVLEPSWSKKVGSIKISSNKSILSRLMEKKLSSDILR